MCIISGVVNTVIFFFLVKRLMKQRDKDSESKSTVSVVVSKLVCTSRSNGQTFSGECSWTLIVF